MRHLIRDYMTMDPPGRRLARSLVREMMEARGVHRLLVMDGIVRVLLSLTTRPIATV